MAKITTRLTDKDIKSAKPKDKEYNLFDGDAFDYVSSLTVQNNGSLTTTNPLQENEQTLA
ncbi:hypothetical protein A1QW_14265 [Vibrio anguillarum]|nr:hypothetical protein A1QW_14265 [Vibrio anguillarum]OEF89009.1 hypothetical protein A1QY_03890 [Vibrio anguillarum]